MLSKKYILIFFLLIIGADESFLFAQNFNSIRSKYENFEENNDTALPFVKKYIDKAKKKKIILIYHKDIWMQGIIILILI